MSELRLNIPTIPFYSKNASSKIIPISRVNEGLMRG